MVWGWSRPVPLCLRGSVWFSAGLCWSRCVCVVLCGSVWFWVGFRWSLVVSAVFAVLCWFCAGLCWSLPVSLFCAGFVLVSAGRCRFRCFVLVLCWSLLVYADFAVLSCRSDRLDLRPDLRSRPLICVRRCVRTYSHSRFCTMCKAMYGSIFL